MTIAQEKTAAGRIIDRALAKGYMVSVYDGEEYVVKSSRKRHQIMTALGSTDTDQLIIRDGKGNKIGTILLIWGNSPEEVVADHTDQPEINALVGE